MEVNIMYSKKALPVGTMFLVLVIALAVLGVGYAFWSETLTISGTVQTGEVDVEFSTYDPVECVDTQTGLCQPEPAGKETAAECTVEWSQNNTEAGDDGFDQLLVTVTGMYPSYHCKVSFDVTSTGSVPVHVKWPEPTGDIPEWVATDFESCYPDSIQLHKDESTDPCTIDIHFTNEQAPPEGSGPYTFGWTILAHQWNEEPPSGPVVTPGYDPTAVLKAALNYRALINPAGLNGFEGIMGLPNFPSGSPQNDFYRGVSCDGSTPYGSWNPSNHVKFTYDGINTLTAQVDANPSYCMTYDIGDLDGLNYLQLDVVNRAAGTTVNFNNVTLNGISLGNFTGSGWSTWQVTGLDFTSGFTVEGDLVLAWPTPPATSGQETNKLVLQVGYLP
jgi:predicted ribosomally synthesized peptide with SipW-like signal peptide